ncbi:MAG: nucleoside hydrolase [Asticcacaulis sp.]|uniref:nucleoside hydrolase n=1 Tax=Asticcacaulis sp. TaxID=1872648 RepID=UPI0039E289AD
MRPAPVSKKGRRTFLRGAVAAAGAVATRCLAGPVSAPRYRLIVDNDLAGDPDGTVALVHQLLSPTAQVSLITTSALDSGLARMAGLAHPDQTAASGAGRANEIVNRIRPRVVPKIVAGAETFGVSDGQISAAAEAIVAEANRADPLPLYLTCGGPLTNIAAALRRDPSIASRMTLIWIGGCAYPEGGAEYNLMTDPAAARQVIEQSQVPLWQVPEAAYKQVTIAFSELEQVADQGLAQWTYDRLIDIPPFVKLDGARSLGDSAMVLLTALSPDAGRFQEIPARQLLTEGQYGAPIPGRTLRVYDALDGDLVIRDFLARLQLFDHNKTQRGNSYGH